MTVQELAELVMQRVDGVPQCSILDAVREVQSIITRRLFFWRDKSLKSTATLTFGAGIGAVTLPSGYLGQNGVPYLLVEDAVSRLSPVLSQQPTAAATPLYYETTGTQLVVYPPTLAELIVHLPSFIAPAVPTTLAAELPFLGAHDGIFIDGCTRMASAGRLLASDQAFRASLQDQIDVFVQGNQLAAEQVTADEINEQAQSF